MSTARIVGIILLVIGIGLLYFGWQATEQLGEQARELVTGRYSDGTTWQLIAGGVCSALGVALLLFGGSSARRR